MVELSKKMMLKNDIGFAFQGVCLEGQVMTEIISKRALVEDCAH